MEEEDHDYPFAGSKHLNPIGINHDPVRMSLRTKNDFDNLKKLEDPLAPPPITKTNYEAYQKHETKSKTKGLFQSDPQRIAVTRHSASFQPEEVRSILSINPGLKAYLDKQMNLEDKKLAVIRQNRVYLDEETKLNMKKTERAFFKKLAKQQRSTWQREMN